VEEVTQDPHLLVMEEAVVGVTAGAPGDTAGVPEGATGMFRFLYLVNWSLWLPSAIYVAHLLWCPLDPV
jgi:hypothetical protein